METSVKNIIIWLVDDDDIFRFLCKKIILDKNSSIQIVEFENGKEALDSFTKDSVNLPNIIFLDINMPIMNGWEFLGNLKNIQDIKLAKSEIYLLSSTVNSTDKQHATTFPFLKGFLEKPFKSEYLTSLNLMVENSNY